MKINVYKLEFVSNSIRNPSILSDRLHFLNYKNPFILFGPFLKSLQSIFDYLTQAYIFHKISNSTYLKQNKFT